MKLFSKTIALAFLFAATTVFAGAPVKNGLVLYFTTVGTTVKDASGAKNFGQTSGVIVSNSPSLNSMAQTHQLTYCAWIRPNSIPSEFPELLGKGGNSQPGAFGGYEFTLNANPDHDLLFQSGFFQVHGETRFISTNLGQWIHIAFTIDTDAQTMQFYVNDQLVDAVIDNGTFADVNFEISNNLYVAEKDPAVDGNRANFDGQMHAVMLFNRALSADEIQTIFTKTAPKGGRNGHGGGVFPGN